MFDGRPVLLNRDLHRTRRIRPGSGFGFARRAHALAIAGVEFNEACKEYPIVFTRAAHGELAPVAVLGLRDGDNLFLDDDGQWTARYVPACVRSHPFVLAQLPGQQLGLCIDEACPAINDEEGEALFDASRATTPFLQKALDFVQRYREEALRTEAFCRRLEQAGLLTAIEARADLLDGRRFTLAGLQVVDEKKLMALPDATVLSLFRAGEMHLVAMHLLSLSNLQRLADRMAQKPQPLHPAPRP